MAKNELLDSIEEADVEWFGSISERCVYLYLRYHADKKGIFRLAMTELAAMLNVNRQTVLKHVETLTQKRLVRRSGHGRYTVYAAPWSLESEVLASLNSLKPGDLIDAGPICMALYGRPADEMYGDVFLGETSYGDLLTEIWDAILNHDGTRIKEDAEGHIRLIK